MADTTVNSGKGSLNSVGTSGFLYKSRVPNTDFVTKLCADLLFQYIFSKKPLAVYGVLCSCWGYTYIYCDITILKLIYSVLVIFSM